MKFKKTKLKRADTVAREECIIPKYGMDPWVFTVSAYPLTLNRTIVKLLPEPVPPKRVLMEEGTNKPLLDSERKPIPYDDTSDADYKSKVVERNQYKNAWLAYAALQFDTDLEFETQFPEKPDTQNIKAFLKELTEEFEESGFSTGDIALVIDTAMKLCNLWDADVKEARDSFLSQRSQKEQPGSSQNEQEEPSDTLS